MNDHLNESANESANDSPWLPVVMPVVVFAAAAIVLPAVGIFLLTIALSTYETFQAPVPHSTAVIIIALSLSLVIGGVAAIVAMRDERAGSPPVDHDHAGH